MSENTPPINEQKPDPNKELVLSHIGVPGATAGKCTVGHVAQNSTILLANSNTRNISLFRDRLGGG
jgi:hypothetical protein